MKLVYTNNYITLKLIKIIIIGLAIHFHSLYIEKTFLQFFLKEHYKHF